MTAEQWSSVRRLLDAALDRPEDRPALLANLRDRDPEVCDELERLLGDIEGEEDPDGEPEIEQALRGQTVGPYTIVREIGRGGSGTVFLAAREEAGVRVEVALKFLRRDFLGGAPRPAIQRELRALARLDHPHIVRLLNWGTIPVGLLYLAIEYVNGQTITQYCAEKRLGLADRLALFQQVCEAVEHAHRNLVVHRDLKPSNIFVDASGRVKLLDFGIAAVLDSRAEPTTLARRSLTPAYASPEQIEGRDVSVATDIYSLGLVLYELLAGRLPHSKDAKFWATVHNEPTAPSKHATLAEVTAREIAGDLDVIVLKAIQREPERRYPSVEQFAADLRRFREGRPVLARRGSRLYVAGRFLRRNRLNVAAAFLALIALAGTAGIAVWKWRAANRNLAQAQRDYQELRGFAGAVISNVNARNLASPTEGQRRMSETVARYLDRLSNGRQDDQELQLQIASAYRQLGVAQGDNTSPSQGDTNAALANFQKSYQICLKQWRTKGSRNSGVGLLTAAHLMAGIQPDPATAAAFLSSAIDATAPVLSRNPKDEDVLLSYSAAYGALAQRVRFTGDLPAAAGDFQKAIDLADRALAIEPRNIGALNYQEGYTSEKGNTLRMEGRFDEALAYATKAREIALQALALQPSNHNRREAAYKLLSRCEVLRELKRYPEALQDVQEAVTQLEEIASQDAFNNQAKTELSLAYFRLGNIKFSQGRIGDALKTHREALLLREDQYARHSSNLMALRNYQRSLTRVGEILLAAQQTSSAEAHFDHALALGNDLMKQTPSDVYAAADVAKAYQGKAMCALRSGRRAEAAELVRQSVGIWRDVRQRTPLDVGVAAAAGGAERSLAQLVCCL